MRREGSAGLMKRIGGLKDGGLGQGADIRQSKLGTGGRWMLSVRLVLQQSETQRETVSAYRFVTMLEILSTEGRLGHN